MTIAVVRKNLKSGKYSKTLTIPSQIEKGEKSSIVGDRLLIVDPLGEIPPGELLEFFETVIEPAFWRWKGEDGRRRSKELVNRPRWKSLKNGSRYQPAFKILLEFARQNGLLKTKKEEAEEDEEN